MNRTCILLVEILGGIGVFFVIFGLLRNSLKGSTHFHMDPVEADESVKEVTGGFEPHLKRYQELAQLILTLATATVAFLVNFLVGIRVDEKRSLYSLKLESACPSSIVFLGFSALFAIAFILRENQTYEGYCHAPRRDTYTAGSYATNLALGYSCIIWFLFAYAFLAYRLLI